MLVVDYVINDAHLTGEFEQATSRVNERGQLVIVEAHTGGVVMNFEKGVWKTVRSDNNAVTTTITRSV